MTAPAPGSDPTAPLTTAIPTGWRRRLDPRPAFTRVQDSAMAIVQITVAATGAYVFAELVLGHPQPLLAATVTVSSLGLVRDARPRRVLDTVIGMLVGVLIAELFVIVAGQGGWQLAMSLGATLLVARFLSPQASFAIAAAIQSIIVMVVPAVGAFDRLIDGIVGGIAALLVTALIPRNPRRAEERAARAVFASLDAAAAAIAQGLRRGDKLRAARGLEKARAMQSVLDDWRTTLESSRAIVRIAPFLRGHRHELDRHELVRDNVELACRNMRVVARRAVYLVDDGVRRPVPADLLGALARSAIELGRSLDDISLVPVVREQLLAVASRLDPRELLPDGTLGEHNLIAALRPIAVDLLVATGLTQDEARAAVPRI